MRQSKLFIAPSEEKAKYYLDLQREELRKITGILAGHCPVQYHLSKMGLIEDLTCRLCMEEEKTAEHILCDCEALAYQRFKHLGKALLRAEEIRAAQPRDLKGFISSIQFIWERL